MKNQKKKILIVEDDPTFSLLLKTWCQKNDYEPVAVFSIGMAQHEILSNSFELILSDLRLPDSDGIMFLTWLKDKKNNTPVIILTNYADIQTAVAAMKLGAFDFMEKPINHLVLKEKVEVAVNSRWCDVCGERREISNSKGKKEKKIGVRYNNGVQTERKRKTRNSVSEIENWVAGKSKVAEEMYKHIELVAPTDLSVLIFGETGTGKEHVAQTIHFLSKRKNAPFMAVDCGVLSKELAASELFGHVKGSFTSAGSDKSGVFEDANEGTVFFDEIGNLPYEVQIQLLRTLQERKIRRVGSTKEVTVDVRIICASNENLIKAVQEGNFREDLYHRLQEFTIEVPALRNRVEDIELFCNFFREQANIEVSKNVEFIAPETLTILKQQLWNGNLRELKNVIRRSVLFSGGNIILPEHLPVFPKVVKPPVAGLFDEKEEKQRIINALHISGGNKKIAAIMLNIDRKTLYNKIHLYEIELN
jgi:two-component system response regulator HydG